ncbi:MAG TPA: hypothetical protein VLT36_25255 [Candidatus Dormibacteraeota bacterium]|nr:hypothetical protein [Candidatus Dormibacteraeota bacterium]
MDQKGKTIWEMLMDRLHKGDGNGAGIPFLNPLDLRVSSALNVPYSNGPEFAGFDFSVQEIREYTRRINGQDFRFTDYVLSGVNTKSFEAEGKLLARVRVVPNQAGSKDSLLLRVYDEFGFSEDFLQVVKDNTGIFEMTDGDSGKKETYNRINDLREPYDAAVLVIGETTADGKAATGKTSAQKVQYWDYWRDVDLGNGKTAKEFVFVEMNSDSGWFQIWRGREFFQ